MSMLAIGKNMLVKNYIFFSIPFRLQIQYHYNICLEIFLVQKPPISTVLYPIVDENTKYSKTCNDLVSP